MDFRQYDNALGRFLNPDRFAELSPYMTPFRFGFNNPNFWSDPSGLWEPINGGYTTNDPADIANLMSYINGTHKNTNANNVMEFVNEEVTFANNMTLEGVSVFTGNEKSYNNAAKQIEKNIYKSQGDSALSNLSETGFMISAASFRLTTIDRIHIGKPLPGLPINFFGRKYIGNGNTYIKGSYLSKLGRGVGYGGFGLGLVVDGIGVTNYIVDPNDPNAVHPAKAGVNTAVGAYGLSGAGAVPSLLYFGVDAFYPGGWTGDGQNNGALTDYGNTVQAYHGATGKPFAYGSMK